MNFTVNPNQSLMQEFHQKSHLQRKKAKKKCNNRPNKSQSELDEIYRQELERAK
jgi:hypothetical protein